MSCKPNDALCIATNCSGAIGRGTTLFNYWQTHDCPGAYAQVMNTYPDGTLQYNPQNQQTVQKLVINLFQTYFTTNQITDDITSPQYNNFQNNLLDLCIDTTLPGACEASLTNYCNNYNRDQVTNSPVLTNFCGCYVEPDPVYLQYTLGTSGCLIGSDNCNSCSAEDESCTGQPACDPLCHRALTSQKAYTPTGDIITCYQNICAISDVTVRAYNSSIPGNINFNNVCAGCGGADGGAGCLCVISGVNIPDTMGQLGVTVNFNQYCGPNSVCVVEDDFGNIISNGPCDSVDFNDLTVGAPSSFPKWGIVFLIFIFVIVVFAAVIAEKIAGQKVIKPDIFLNNDNKVYTL